MNAIRSRPAVQLGQAQQTTGEPRRHAEQRGFFGQSAGPANALAKKLQQVGDELRFTLQQGQKVLAQDDHELGGRGGAGRGRAVMPVQQGNLAERIARLHDVEKHLLAIRRSRADANLARDHAVQRVAGIRL